MAIKPITFEEALHGARGCKKRHLLLGNGFSIALRPDIFSYQSLYENADFSKAPHAKKIFELLGTSDFETVIRAIVKALQSGGKKIRSQEHGHSPNRGVPRSDRL